MKRNPQSPRARRDAIIRNLHRLGCPQAAIAEGFGLTSIVRIVTRKRDGQPRPWRNACSRHNNVRAECRDCRREFVAP